MDAISEQHEQRKRKADASADPAYFFSYVLRLDDGSFYIGSTNAPLARWTEHAAGVGAKATAGKQFRVVLAIPFASRREAEYNEKRMQSALQRGSEHIEGLISVWEQMVNVVRPQKTLTELETEERHYENTMQRVMHYSKALIWNPGGLPPTACGYRGPKYYSTNEWETLRKMARDEDFTGNIYGREVCRLCLEHAPQENEAEEANRPAGVG